MLFIMKVFLYEFVLLQELFGVSKQIFVITSETSRPSFKYTCGSFINVAKVIPDPSPKLKLRRALVYVIGVIFERLFMDWLPLSVSGMGEEVLLFYLNW